MSASGHSTVSTTDVNVFKRLANPAIVDVHVDSRVRRATAEMKQAIEQAATVDTRRVDSLPNSPVDSLVASAPTKTVFQKAQEKATEEVERAWTVQSHSADPPLAPLLDAPAPSSQSPTVHCAPAREFFMPAAQMEHDASSNPVHVRDKPRQNPHCNLAHMRETSRLDAPPPTPTHVRGDSGENSDYENDAEDSSSEQWKQRDGQSKRLEKQGYIIELSNMRQKGIALSREFTMNDSIAELEFEIQKQQNNATTRQHVAFMRDMLKIGINGLEIANTRFGPFLSIDGWAESVTQDMNKYEPPLEKLYRRYFRRSQMSPMMELAWLLIGSMAAFHFKNKFFQSPLTTTRAAAERESEGKTTSRLKRPASSDTSRKVNGGQRTGRPVLRPPSSLFGM